MSRSIKTAFIQIRRTPYQALAAIMILALSFWVLSIFLIISYGSEKILKHFEKTPQVIAFFEKGQDLSIEQQEDIRRKLEQTGKLASFKYVSTREAEKIYKEKNKDDPLLLELVDYKILPASIEISATEIDTLPLLKKILEGEPAVKDIIFYEDIVNALSAWVKRLRAGGLIIISYLLIQSTLIILIISGMKILFRKEEIKILSLIGASSWFIRWPFLFEGIFYGMLGAIFGWLFAYLLLLYSTPFLLKWLGDFLIFPIPFTYLLVGLGGQVLLGAFVGLFGSFLAVHRFLPD